MGKPGFAMGKPGFAMGKPGSAMGKPGFAIGKPDFAESCGSHPDRLYTRTSIQGKFRPEATVLIGCSNRPYRH
jgi:hypothetical protein